MNCINIPKGYKETEIGWIPNDWDVVDFGDIIDYIKGFPFKSEDYKNYGVRIIRVSDTTYDSIKNETPVFVDSKKSYCYNKWKLLENDLIFSTVGSKPPMYDSLVGKTILITKKYEGSLLNQNAVLIRVKDKKSYKQKLLLNHFRTKRYIEYIEKIFRGNANQASITLKDLFEFKIPLSKYDDEQEAIANVLSDIDELIQLFEKLIAKKRAIKQGAMQELLTGKRRLPGFSEKWETKTLGCICDYQNGTSLEKYFNDNDGFKVISIGNYSPDGKFVITNTYIDRRLKSVVKNFILNKNELTMILNDKTAVGTIIGRVLLIENDDTYVFNQRTMRLIPKNGVLPKFLYFKLNSDAVHRKIVAASKPGTQIYVNTNDIVGLEILIPQNIDEQSAIADVLSDIRLEIEVLEQKLNKYKMLKQGMMQVLLTGKVRLI